MPDPAAASVTAPPTAAHPADVTVVIPNWNGAARLARVLDSLARQTLAAALVIVVDNGSSDSSLDIAHARGARVIALDANHGFSRAVNLGVAAATTLWVAIVNNDLVLADDWLERLLSAAGAVSAPFACPRLLRSSDPAQLDGCFDLLARSACACRVGHGHVDSERFRSPARVHSAPFTAALFERALFTRLGGLDERFGSYLEDVDFGLRCALAGESGLYCPDAVAWHEGSATLGAWSPRMVELIARNQLLLVAKHFPQGWLRPLGWPVFVGQLLWGVAALRRGRFLPWLRGKRAGLRLYHAMRRASSPPPLSRLQPLLAANEALLRDYQNATGGDRYWRTYFAWTS